MRRTAGAFTCAIVIATLAITAQPRAIAQDDSIALALLDQTFAIAPNGVVHLEYELTGTIPDATPPAALPDPAAPGTTASTNTSQPGDTTTVTTPPPVPVGFVTVNSSPACNAPVASSTARA